MVSKLDRLGRRIRHLIETVGQVQEQKGGIRSLQESIETTTSGGLLNFYVFAALAEFEHDIIHERTSAGLEAARAHGKRGGRPRKEEVSGPHAPRHEIADDSAVNSLRSKLQELFDHPLPRGLVISFEFVSRLSHQALGAVLTHKLRLERAGGGIRICNASHKLMATLDQIHFTMLIDCYTTLDDAILVDWE